MLTILVNISTMRSSKGVAPNSRVVNTVNHHSAQKRLPHHLNTNGVGRTTSQLAFNAGKTLTCTLQQVKLVLCVHPRLLIDVLRFDLTHRHFEKEL